ncbi:MAG: amidohydrolase family protein [Chitinophagales bacterium]|nr:amidohydrolase family protein [Chitinophagales bacterium]
MKQTLTAITLLFSLACHAQPALQEADIIVRHANIITMKDSVPLQDQLLCIKDNRISYIGADNKKAISTTAKVIDAKGRYLMPGMAEMHVHLPGPDEIKQFLTLNLMGGITMVRAMRGREEQLAYRDIKDYAIPHLYISTPIITRFTPLDDHSADSLVQAYKHTGYDFIKFIDIKDSISFDNLMKYANQYELTVCGHTPGNVALEYVLTSGFNCVEHLQEYVKAYKQGPEYFNKILRLTKDNHVYQSPTLDWYSVYFHQYSEEVLKKRAGLEYIPDSTQLQWHEEIAAARNKIGDSAYNAIRSDYAAIEIIKTDIVKQMAQMGIPLLTSPEGGEQYMVAGYNMIEEMKRMQQAGLSNYELLQCATINPAKYMHRDGEVGTLEVGKEASMILLAGNPLKELEAITHVDAVLLDNKVYTHDELLAQLNN